MFQNIWSTNPSPIRKKSLFDWSEIGFIISNFLCQNVQTTLGGEVWTKSEHPNFLRPYLPRGGGHRSFGQCPKFFFMAFLSRLPSSLMNCGICTNRKWNYRHVSKLPLIFVIFSPTLVKVRHTFYCLKQLPFFQIYILTLFSFS